MTTSGKGAATARATATTSGEGAATARARATATTGAGDGDGGGGVGAAWRRRCRRGVVRGNCEMKMEIFTGVGYIPRALVPVRGTTNRDQRTCAARVAAKV